MGFAGRAFRRAGVLQEETLQIPPNMGLHNKLYKSKGYPLSSSKLELLDGYPYVSAGCREGLPLQLD